MVGLMANWPTYAEVLNAAMAGCSAAQIADQLETLNPDDRQRVLSTLCAIQNEIARDSNEHGHEIAKLLGGKCPLPCARGTTRCPFKN